MDQAPAQPFEIDDILEIFYSDPDTGFEKALTEFKDRRPLGQDNIHQMLEPICRYSLPRADLSPEREESLQYLLTTMVRDKLLLQSFANCLIVATDAGELEVDYEHDEKERVASQHERKQRHSHGCFIDTWSSS